ncbi:Zn-ribbon domain-containing OB-fold protein [Halovenus marina]|uniref:Zn-ribbon domain-containing OB-fold protein n=1 Tax=Halovenus marina TaxID=3396621 RepID=UPI003F575FB6
MSERLLAGRCDAGHATVPPMSSCPHCGRTQDETIDLTDSHGTVLSWTESAVTPTGVREPNGLALVEFSAGDTQVRVLGQTTGSVAVGDTVRPVYVDRLRDPERSLRDAASQEWDGHRFERVRSD